MPGGCADDEGGCVTAGLCCGRGGGNDAVGTSMGMGSPLGVGSATGVVLLAGRMEAAGRMGSAMSVGSAATALAKAAAAAAAEVVVKVVNCCLAGAGGSRGAVAVETHRSTSNHKGCSSMLNCIHLRSNARCD